MSMTIMSTSAVPATGLGSSPAVLPSITESFGQLVSPMTSGHGTGLSGRAHVAGLGAHGYAVVAGVDITPVLTAPFAATRPSSAVPSAPARDVRSDVRADVAAAKQASPPRGTPR